jgi:4-hydroxy-tetrahydrodipicolinate synthase
MARKEIVGIQTLAPTVFNENREPDIEGFKENLRYLEEVGMHGVVFGASVGQYYQLNHKEWKKYASAARDVLNKSLLLCGSHFWNTKEAILRSKYADDIGADGLFMIQPYFTNWLDEDECFQHYKAVHDATKNVQIMYYNYEASGHITSIDGWERLLKECPRITACKECTPSVEMGELARRYKGRLNSLSGAESALYQIMALGGVGSVGVWATGYPEWAIKFYDLCKEGKWSEALEYHFALGKHLYEGRGPGSAPDYTLGGNASIALAAGRNGGPVREPFAKATAKTIEFHRRWLKEIGASYGFKKKKKPKSIPGLELPPIPEPEILPYP